MTLEQRLTDALHRLDDYQPSVDLWARTTRSIEEDRKRVRRLWTIIFWVVFGVMGIGAFLASLAERTASGALVVPKWSLVVVQVIVSVVIVLSLAPMIRRFGHAFLDVAFHVNPEAGRRFSTLLDIAYYLTFGGLIVTSLSLSGLNVSPHFMSALLDQIRLVARLLAIMGIAHALNLLAIPVVGLVFGSVVRRAKRHAAGDAAPPVSQRAQQADRVATWIVYGIGGWIVANLLVLVGLVTGGLLGS